MATLVSSAVLGSIYSLPPFRLKRFPLLAALCILVIRGSVVNIGFYLQAKQQVLHYHVPSILSGLQSFPECWMATAFFAIFGIVIAMMKDVPDVKGDALNGIPTFSVRLGTRNAFRYVCCLPTSPLRYAQVCLVNVVHSSRFFIVSFIAWSKTCVI